MPKIGYKRVKSRFEGWCAVNGYAVEWLRATLALAVESRDDRAVEGVLVRCRTHRTLSKTRQDRRLFELARRCGLQPCFWTEERGLVAVQEDLVGRVIEAAALPPERQAVTVEMVQAMIDADNARRGVAQPGGVAALAAAAPTEPEPPRERTAEEIEDEKDGREFDAWWEKHARDPGAMQEYDRRLDALMEKRKRRKMAMEERPPLDLDADELERSLRARIAEVDREGR